MTERRYDLFHRKCCAMVRIMIAIPTKDDQMIVAIYHHSLYDVVVDDCDSFII